MEFYIRLAHDWQELVGAFLGSSLAIIFSGIGFLIARYIQRVDERREALRQVEIGNTYSLHTAYTMQMKLRFFVTRARKLVSDLRSNTTDNEIIFDTINFPSLGEIFLDSTSHSARIKSYYLHNKLLLKHAGTTEINLILAQFKEDFANIVRMNELMISVTSGNPKPLIQRSAYADNLENFANEVERLANEEIPKGIKVMLQIRAYNSKLRRTFGRGLLNRLSYEGIFSSGRNLDMVDRIDGEIEEEVNEIGKAAQQRADRVNDLS